MKMGKAVPVFILFLTGHLCNNMNVAAGTIAYGFSHTETTTELHNSAPKNPTVMPTPGSKIVPYEDHSVPERLPTIVAGVSISFLLIFLLVIIAIWYARRRSKGSSAEINSVPSGEPGVSLKKMSTHENQHEWPFERAL